MVVPNKGYSSLDQSPDEKPLVALDTDRYCNFEHFGVIFTKSIVNNKDVLRYRSLAVISSVDSLFYSRLLLKNNNKKKDKL